MSSMPVTSRFSLPLLATAQAQKEMTHNEALVLIDALVQLAVEAGPQADPPTDPDEGQCWLVGATPTGGWAGQAHAVAVWTAGGWRFAIPREGLRAWRIADGAWIGFKGGTWVAPSPISVPSGGAVIDSEARVAIDNLILLLEAHGILISA